MSTEVLCFDVEVYFFMRIWCSLEEMNFDPPRSLQKKNYPKNSLATLMLYPHRQLHNLPSVY